MKAYNVTVLHEGKLHAEIMWHTSVSELRKYITNYWNSLQMYDVKIVKIEPITTNGESE